MLIENGKVGNLQYYDSNLTLYRSRSLSIVFCLVGKIQIETETQRVELCQKEFNVIKPMSMQKIIVTENTNYLVLKIDPLFLDKLDFDFTTVAIDLTHKDIYYRSIAKKIIKLLSFRDVTETFEATILILEILNILKLYFKQDQTSSKSQIIDQITQYIDHNFQMTLSLEDLSEVFSITPQYISRLFKTEKQTTFLKYINHIRLERSLDPLISSEYSILDIALEYGFPNSTSYTKVFKENFGCLPSEYRKEKRRTEAHVVQPIAPPSEEIEKLVEQELNINRYVVQYDSLKQVKNTTLNSVYFKEFNQATEADYRQVIRICESLKLDYLRIPLLVQDLIDDQDSYLIRLEKQLKLLMRAGFYIVLDFPAISLLDDRFRFAVHRLLRYFTNIISIDNIKHWRLSFDFEDILSEAYPQVIQRMHQLDTEIHQYIDIFEIMIELNTTEFHQIPIFLHPSHHYVYAFSIPSELVFEEYPLVLRRLDKLKREYGITKIQLRKKYPDAQNLLNDTVYEGIRFIREYLRVYGVFEEIEIPQLIDWPNSERMMMSGQKGLVTWQGARKPLFYVMNFLKSMGPKYILHDKYCIASTHMGRDYSILCQYSYDETDHLAHITTYDEYEQLVINEEKKTYLFHFKGLKNGNYRIKIRYVNHRSGNLLEYWKKLDYTKSLSGGEYEYLEKKSIPSMYLTDETVVDGTYTLSLELRKNEFAYIHLIYKY